MLRMTALAATAALAVAGCANNTDEDLFHRLSKVAEAGSPAAQYNLGMLYNNGIGVEQDASKAFHWFEKAATGGDPLGHYKVGCYYAGQFQGVVTPDHTKALTYKLAAAEAGYVLAQHDVALAYAEMGEYENAAKWLTSAAEQGDIAALAALSEWHKEGRGVRPDLAKAYEYLLVAVRLVPEAHSQRAKPVLQEFRGALDDATALKAEQSAASWTEKRSALTLRAAHGIEEAKRLTH
jgi:TPR repeat protein